MRHQTYLKSDCDQISFFTIRSITIQNNSVYGIKNKFISLYHIIQLKLYVKYNSELKRVSRQLYKTLIISFFNIILINSTLIPLKKPLIFFCMSSA
jgi:hypothetical protein